MNQLISEAADVGTAGATKPVSNRQLLTAVLTLGLVGLVLVVTGNILSVRSGTDSGIVVHSVGFVAMLCGLLTYLAASVLGRVKVRMRAAAGHRDESYDGAISLCYVFMSFSLLYAMYLLATVLISFGLMWSIIGFLGLPISLFTPASFAALFWIATRILKRLQVLEANQHRQTDLPLYRMYPEHSVRSDVSNTS